MALFSLRALIREKLQEGVEPSPAKIADALAEEVESRYLRLALSQALPYLVRDEIRKLRHAAFGRHSETRSDTGGKRVPPSDALVAAASGEPVEQPTEGAKARGGTLAFTIYQVPISFGPGHWKYLGDCTREEVLEGARHLAQRAAENQARADSYQRLAEHMEKAGVDVVRDVEPETLRSIVDPKLYDASEATA